MRGMIIAEEQKTKIGTNNKMVDLSLTISVIVLKVNSLLLKK